MNLGFTGTREGMNGLQHNSLKAVLKALVLKKAPITSFHGGCIGADAQFHRLALLYTDGVEVYPSNLKNFQAVLEGDFKVHKERPPLERNTIIVQKSELMIATPKENTESRKGGTWFTIRYASLQAGRPTLVLYPNGVKAFTHFTDSTFQFLEQV